MAMDWRTVAMAACVAAAGTAGAQQAPPQGTHQPTYKCKGKSGPVYQAVPCRDGRKLDATKNPRPSARRTPPPQDRAVRTQKAARPAAIKEECAALESRIAAEQARLKALPQPATDADEKDLVTDRMRFRKLRC
jgi:hypothetical protein